MSSSHKYCMLSQRADNPGVPLCWYLNIENIIVYINENRSSALTLYCAQTGGTELSFNFLVNNVLLWCLHNRSPYAYNANRQIIEAWVCFHFRTRHEVPISDVYGALGWFMSYAEQHVIGANEKLVLQLVYTRLCNIIGDACYDKQKGHIPEGFLNSDRQDVVRPAMTHMLSHSSYPLLIATLEETGGDQKHRLALSASLPWAPKSDLYNRRDAKYKVRDSRIAMIVELVGQQVVNRMSELEKGHVGNCAESLTFASLFEQGLDVANLGQAMICKKVPAEFTSLDRILKVVHCSPCKSCRELFRNGRMTFQDAGSAKIYGKLQPGTELPERIARRNKYTLCKGCMIPFNLPEGVEFHSDRCQEIYDDFCARNSGYPPNPPANYDSPFSTPDQPHVQRTFGVPSVRPANYQTWAGPSYNFYGKW